MAYYLKANKTKLVQMLCRKGYHPTVKQARFQKGFRKRTYTLAWQESDGFYEARLLSAAGRGYLRVTHGEKSVMHTIHLSELKALDMVEEVQKS